MTQQQTSDWLNAGTVDDILHNDVPALAAVELLLSRDPKPETA